MQRCNSCKFTRSILSADRFTTFEIDFYLPYISSKAMYEALLPGIMAKLLECSFCLLRCVKGFALFRLAGFLKPTPNNAYLEGGAHSETGSTYFNPSYRNKIVSNLR